jgi:hypothetical protein
MLWVGVELLSWLDHPCTVPEFWLSPQIHSLTLNNVYRSEIKVKKGNN